MENKSYDAIVIGTGLSGLTAARVLTESNRNINRVLLLERHTSPGGCLQSFKRGRDKSWEVGLHYIGKMESGSFVKRLFDYVTGSEVKWKRMEEPFDKIHYPGLSGEIYGDEDRFEQELIGKFPDEENGIKKYIKDMKKASVWFTRDYFSMLLPGFLSTPLRFLNRVLTRELSMTLKEYLEANFSSCEARAYISSRWGKLGIPPAACSFLLHAVVCRHYMEGAYYPVGGSNAIVKSITGKILKTGSEIKTGYEVERILVDKGKAVGVEACNRDGGVHRFYAGRVVSGIGVYETVNNLLRDGVKKPRMKMNGHKLTSSFVMSFLKLKSGVGDLGITPGNIWIYNDYDHDMKTLNRNLALNTPGSCFMSILPESCNRDGSCSATVISTAEYGDFASGMIKGKTGTRTDRYTENKEKLGESLIALIESHYPGFTKYIEYAETGTPLTAKDWLGHASGHLYGVAGTPEKYKDPMFKVKTPVKNLYFTGTDITLPGVASALLSGFATASVISGSFAFMKLFKKL
ncbi:MAG: phytoene desaturase family protein [Chitinivibrionales bacterium]